MKTMTRRDALRVGVASGLGLVPALGATANSTRKAKAERLVLINLIGGPSQLDTWDPKPHAPDNIRGPFGTIATRTTGLRFSELFPHLAAISNRLAVVRTVHHTLAPVHEMGLRILNTGRATTGDAIAPPLGVAFGGKEVLLPGSGVNCGIDAPVGLERTNAVPSSLCFNSMLNRTINLLEAGTRTVTITQFPTVFDAVTWDCHNAGGALATDLDDIKNTVAPSFDLAFARFLQQLQDRRLLETTLVIASGEFGRTPKLNSTGGRDHWASCWSALIAGGGVQGGTVVGTSDAHGAEPADRPVALADLAATAAFALGKPLPGCKGTPVLELF